MGNISQSSRKTAIKHHATYWEHEQKAELERKERIMKKKTFKELLEELNACEEAADWAESKTWEEVYKTCERGDWLLWLFKRVNPESIRELTLAKGHCAETVIHLMTDERSIKAVKAAISYGNGEIDAEELRDAADAAAAAAAAVYAAADDYAAADAAAAYAAAAAAADAYADAAAAYADAAYAAYAAADADAYADAAYAAYADDAADAYVVYAAEETRMFKLAADICRKHLPIEIWNIYKKESCTTN